MRVRGNRQAHVARLLSSPAHLQATAGQDVLAEALLEDDLTAVLLIRALATSLGDLRIGGILIDAAAGAVLLQRRDWCRYCAVRLECTILLARSRGGRGLRQVVRRDLLDDAEWLREVAAGQRILHLAHIGGIEHHAGRVVNDLRPLPSVALALHGAHRLQGQQRHCHARNRGRRNWLAVLPLQHNSHRSGCCSNKQRHRHRPQAARELQVAGEHRPVRNRLGPGEDVRAQQEEDGTDNGGGQILPAAITVGQHKSNLANQHEAEDQAQRSRRPHAVLGKGNRRSVVGGGDGGERRDQVVAAIYFEHPAPDVGRHQQADNRGQHNSQQEHAAVFADDERPDGHHR